MTVTNDRSQVPATSVTTWKIDQEASRVEFTARMRLMFVMKVTVLDDPRRRIRDNWMGGSYP
jgi:hypothetical protein